MIEQIVFIIWGIGAVVLGLGFVFWASYTSEFAKDPYSTTFVICGIGVVIWPVAIALLIVALPFVGVSKLAKWFRKRKDEADS